MAAEGKKIVWKFDKDTQTISIDENNSSQFELEKQFTFKLTRYKDNDSKKELLHIQCKLDGEPNGSKEVAISNIERPLREFADYGAAFSGLIYADLQKTIELSYLKLEKEEYISEDDEKMVTVCKMLGEIISTYDLKDGMYHIPVEQFDQLLDEDNHHKSEIKAIKQWLKGHDYTMTSGDRLSYLVRLKDKPIRAISIKKEKIEPHMPNKPEPVIAGANA